jgi:hypothetical protein
MLQVVEDVFVTHIHSLCLAIQDLPMIDQWYGIYFHEDEQIHTLEFPMKFEDKRIISFILSFSARSLLYFEKASHSSGVICPLIGRHGSGL